MPEYNTKFDASLHHTALLKYRSKEFELKSIEK